MLIAAPASECFLNIAQEFLVCTTIHKAKSLPSLNIDTYVRVTLDKKSKNTKVYTNSENPYYNEYFVFELTCTLAELFRLTVLYEVKKKACCKVHVTLGELLIDLHTVWNQPHKSFYKKWGKLENSIGSKGEAKGYLQIDLSIVSPNQPSIQPIITDADCDDIESNLLQNIDTSPCNIKYYVSFYNGTFRKKSDYLLQVSLAGMNGKTSVSKSTMQPEWNEQIEFSWTYPSLAQTFLVQVMAREHMHWKCIAENEIFFDEISFNATPSLGPTYIHFYDLCNYVGQVLIEIRSEKLDAGKESINRTIVMKAASPFNAKQWWETENFILEFLAWQGEFIHANASNMKMMMKFGGHESNIVECFLKSYSSTTTPVKHFAHDVPFKAIHISCYYPDVRLKYETDHFMLDLVETMRSEMDNFKLFKLKYPESESMHSKCLKAIILSILGKIHDPHNNLRLQYNGFKQLTMWDEHRFSFLKDFFNRFTKSLEALRIDLKTMKDGESSCDKVFEELERLRNQIESIIQNRIQDDWPELQLIMSLGSKSSLKDFAICKLNAQYFMYSQRTDCNARWSGISRNFIFKDVTCSHTCRNCGCIRGIVYGWLRIATEGEQTEFSVSNEWEQKERFYYQPKVEQTSFVCRLYIHQAKVRPGPDKSGLCDAKIKMFFGGHTVESSTIYASLSPVWNESASFGVCQLPGEYTWYEKNPPLIAIQLFDVDLKKADEYLGCGLVELIVQSSTARTEPLKSLAESTIGPLPSESGDESTVIPNEKDGPSPLSMRKFVKTRVALQKLNELKYQSPPLMKWVPIANMGTSRVEVLVSGELLQVGENEEPDGSKAMLTSGIPKGIQPSMARYLLEVIFIGLRSCQKLSSSTLGRYKVYVMMGELQLKSGISGSRLKNSINFLECYTSGIVNLPEQLQYWPAIIATHIDFPGRNREVTLGATLVNNPSKYLRSQPALCDELGQEDTDTVVQMGETEAEEIPLLPPKSILKKSPFTRLWDTLSKPLTSRKVKKVIPHTAHLNESDFNWWTKFYNSLYLNNQNIEHSGKHRLVLYLGELEKEADFSFLSDWAEGYPLVHGIRMKKNRPPKDEVYATLKMHIKLAKCHCNASSITLASAISKMSNKLHAANSQPEQTKVVVRVYVVQGLQFRSHDVYSQSDAYVKLQLGNHTISDRAHYIPNQCSPIFGKRFQMEALIPREHILQISVLDRGGIHDDLIGSTFIDLEDRIRSKHRATVGIAHEYTRSGYNMWRDAVLPSQILKDICKKHNLSQPLFENHKVVVDGVTFSDSTAISLDEDEEERLSLSALKSIHVVPTIGYCLIPEHVETRSLYRSDRPGVEQGKLQLWVEIFHPEHLPPPLDITPTPPQGYELRVVIFNCADVKSEEKNVFGTKMSDIYVKGWCETSEQFQTTDVHYRSLTGEGNFNWRMIFPIKYSNVEDMMVITKKGGLLEQYETKHPPMVYLQIWDNDSFSADDFIASLEICLSHVLQPFESSTECTEKNVGKRRKPMNLFREKVIKGWFPCRGAMSKGPDDIGIVGKLEIELEILNDIEAQAKPAGLGRNPPNALPAPERPDTSFNPLTNPIKAIKQILVPAIKKCLFICLLFVMGIFALFYLIEDLPAILIELIHKIV